jgi:PleD family two-component response regulator
LLVLPQTRLPGAQVKADRVRQQVADLVFPEIADGFRVTALIGIAEYRLGENIEAAIARADAALYQAKALAATRW